MDWNGNLRMPFVSRPAAVADTSNLSSFLYNCTAGYDQFPPAPAVLEMKQKQQQQTLMAMDPKKKRLSNEQLELLENSFQEDIKLDPDRKMKLAKDLGLQPRQIAVWFQNRRARWKGKQLERLYDALKQEYDTVARDKHKLQQEVLALRAILKDEVGKKQVSGAGAGAGAGYTDVISGEETVESTSMNPSFERTTMKTKTTSLHQIAECNYPLNMDDYNNAVMMPPYWPPS